MIGIYKITNKINGKSYIGQSTDIHKRWRNEKTDSNNPKKRSYNYPLMRAFRKYGIENFDFSIIEETKIVNLNVREKYWINFYDTFFNGYNQTLGGDHTAQVEKEKILGVINDLKNTELKHKEIAKKWSISSEMVQGINTGRYWKQDIDYPIQKYKIDIKIYTCKKCGVKISKGATLCIDCYKKDIAKNIPSKDELYSKLTSNKGNFLKTGREYNVTDNAVRKWCVKYGLSKYSRDYK